ncbi:hypothetical protein AVEN_172701-1 [Araneus ventricosus]|uniref:TIL domain-containing protein n=1 Tax=Araneus ventricosus TaxID=182803 RepID=A0A4Y2RPG1_ARAVE|nr:hypothetical protein AVEN_172701-1 [Araneus ventricosus]
MKPASCPENAEFSTCGPSCRPTCKDPYPAPCSGSCVKGCFCKSGFVEDTDGRCVRMTDCSKKCLLPGEEFQECGSTCPDTCENRGRPPPGSCPYRCNRGCFCKKGLYRTKSGQCVPLKDCDRQRHFTTKSKPITKRENTDALAVTVPDDCHGCPNREECEAYCKSFGDFIGLCTGADRLHCRCA